MNRATEDLTFCWLAQPPHQILRSNKVQLSLALLFTRVVVDEQD
ncbi:uncharacterized protein METZ01_LOCUS433086 [marine metagenome]|uniref:Uncharacterized protein n=1 Tax=marine metagenome TaxID=408172 RepID=A0A382YA87_9ZZZZ